MSEADKPQPLPPLDPNLDVSKNHFHQAHLGLAIGQLKIVGVDIGTGGTAFRDYLAKYNKELTPLFPGLDNSLMENNQ